MLMPWKNSNRSDDQFITSAIRGHKATEQYEKWSKRKGFIAKGMTKRAKKKKDRYWGETGERALGFFSRRGIIGKSRRRS